MTTKNSARTLARTGRSMKKREIMGETPAFSFGLIRVARLGRFGRRRRLVLIGRVGHELRLLRIDLGPRDGALHAFRHHPVAWTDPGLDDAVGPLPAARL